MPGHRRFSVVSPAATFGAAVRRTVRLPCAVSAIPISSALTARAVAASGHRLSWFVRCNRFCRLMLPRPLVVCTGGEPLLQLDAPLLEAMHHAGFRVAIETNGTQLALPGMCLRRAGGEQQRNDRKQSLHGFLAGQGRCRSAASPQAWAGSRTPGERSTPRLMAGRLSPGTRPENRPNLRTRPLRRSHRALLPEAARRNPTRVGLSSCPLLS